MASINEHLQITTTREPAESDADYDQRLTATSTGLASLLTDPAELIQPHFLQTLDPSVNTLAYLTVLAAHTSRHPDPSSVPVELLPSVARFLTEAEPVQLRYAGERWRHLIEWTARLTARSQNAHLLVALRDGILRIDPSSATFTSNHLLFVQTCLSIGLPSQALPLLDKDILSLPRLLHKDIHSTLLCSSHELSCDYITTASGISGPVVAQDVQEYHLLGANIYIGQRNYSRASLFLQLVLATPSYNNAVGALNVEAHKKLQLVSLLHNDRPYTIATIDEQGAGKTVSTLAKPYEALADAFVKRDLQKYHAQRDVAGDLWARDGNVGLVDEAAESLRRFRVRDLQTVYAALPIERVATHLSLSTQATIQLVTTMIDAGDLNATLTPAEAQQQATLRFNTQSLSHNETEIQSRLANVQRLSDYIADADRRLATSREYRDFARRQKTSKIGSGANPLGSGIIGSSFASQAVPAGEMGYDTGHEDPMNFDMGAEADDEDLMAA